MSNMSRDAKDVTDATNIVLSDVIRLTLRDGGRAATALREKRLERAIGVIYLPESEYVSHYFSAQLADQFDAVLHFDKTRAVEPLERDSEWEAGEAPDGMKCSTNNLFASRLSVRIRKAFWNAARLCASRVTTRSTPIALKRPAT